MTDTPQTTTKWRFEVEQGEGGWWYVTSPDRPGLLVVASTIADAIARYPGPSDRT
jgi:predicted RNase H-like HicB family nuclease